MPQSSVYVNMVGLHRTLDDSYKLVFALQGWQPGAEPIPERLKEQVQFSAILLPEAVPTVSASTEAR
jgi:hypothetical protein